MFCPLGFYLQVLPPCGRVSGLIEQKTPSKAATKNAGRICRDRLIEFERIERRGRA